MRRLSRAIGLHSDAAIRARLARAVADEADRLELEVEDYVALLAVDEQVLQHLLDRVTVQETAFFRDAAQFDALASVLLPDLARSGAPVRIWSAGCAHGQEAYSLAMLLEEAGVREWQVVATDISTNALARTRAAVYSTREIANVSAERRARFLVRVDAERAASALSPASLTSFGRLDADEFWMVKEDLRTRVEVRRHNVVSDPLPAEVGDFDAVLCRNVLIYLRRQDAHAFLDRLAERLAPRAHLFLGYSESLFGSSRSFELARVGEAFAYRASAPERLVATAASSVAPTGASNEHAVATSGFRPPGAVAGQGPLSAGGAALDAAQPIEVEPPEVFVGDGHAAMARGDHATAVQSYRKAVFLAPDDAAHHEGMATAFAAVGDDVAAARSAAAARAARQRRREHPTEPDEVGS
jgi:chemotaxis protein methyltransferase CheR